jgi:hypothetical protein
MECPHCRNFNPKGSAVCGLCERPLTGEVAATAHPAAGKETSRRSDEQRDEARVATPSKVRLSVECSKCGYLNDSSHSVCEQCQNSLKRGLQLTPTQMTFRSREIVHYLICPLLEPVQLRAESRHVLGRGDDCDVSLPGELVSRHHAAITVKEGVHWLEDLGSANGTLYNGKRLEGPVQLRDGDTIQIGAFHLCHQVRQGHDVSTAEVLKELQRQPTRSLKGSREVKGGAPGEDRSSFAGLLQEVGFNEVLVFLRDNARTGVLRVVYGAHTGGVRYGAGDLVDAWIGDRQTPSKRGWPALRQMARQAQSGYFMFKCEDWAGERHLHEPTLRLLQRVGEICPGRGSRDEH